jgi:hypothetical protein
MKRMIFTVLVTACLMLSAVAQKNRGSKPVVDQTQPQMDQRVADAKKRTGKSVDANRMGTPVADPQRRRHVLCRTLGPEEWGLIFPDIPSDYGGTVCVRK